VIEMREPSSRGTAETAQGKRYELLGLIRTACEALVSSPASIMEAVTVAGAIESGEDTHLIGNMTAWLAQEYGLHADMRANGRTIAVRLTRPAAHPAGERALPGRMADTSY
jgi:hypothetical protein